MCLQCRACEAVCPSGVPYGRIMEHVRVQVAAAPASGRGARAARRRVLRHVVANPRMLKLALGPVRRYSGSGLRPLVQWLTALRPGRLRAMEAQMPANQGAPLRPGADMPPPTGEPAGAALLFTGCIMSEMFGEVHRATARVLASRGFAVKATAGQGCCGALSAHDGDIQFARRLARRNIAVFEGAGDAPIVVNSAGCGAAMKEYGDLLAGDRRWVERARRFSARVKDLSEVLVGSGQAPAMRFNGRVTYQDPCHLVHAQRIREQPRELLRQVEGCELVETAGSDMCCGAAGIYSLVQPEMSAQLRSRKAEQFRVHQPEVIVTANPGCHLQYLAAVKEAGIDAKVMHLAEFLDAAERGAGDGLP
jgi:glycolate oxidase iron-sulfur subunit